VTLPEVGVLGSGRMGWGLARAWAEAGYAVVLGSRDPEAVQARLGAGMPRGLALGSYAQAARAAVVTLATPFRATAELVRQHAAELGGKVIVDITNPFGAAPAGTSGVAVHARALGREARWVAAFKTNYAATIALRDGVARQCLIAADDGEAKATVSRLAEAAGFEPLDCGGLAHALALDLMVPLMIAIDGLQGATGRAFWRFVPGR
jgi:predicted dinucleotide-binding enzyme